MIFSKKSVKSNECGSKGSLNWYYIRLTEILYPTVLSMELTIRFRLRFVYDNYFLVRHY